MFQLENSYFAHLFGRGKRLLIIVIILHITNAFVGQTFRIQHKNFGLLFLIELRNTSESSKSKNINDMNFEKYTFWLFFAIFRHKDIVINGALVQWHMFWWIKFVGWYYEERFSKYISALANHCRQTSTISRTKHQHLDISRLALLLSLLNPSKSGVKSKMKM